MTGHQGGTPPGSDQQPVNLALQGGGAHGAFAWGVLDSCSRMAGLQSMR
jgi:predicted acylesterase/phospholipase RssA